MSKKHIIVTAALTAVVTFFVTTCFYLTPIGKMVYSVAAKSYFGKNYGKFLEIENLLKKSYIGELNEEKMMENAFSSYVSSLGDPYTNYLNKAALKNMKENLNGDYNGIGITVNKKNGKIYVAQVKSGSPAEKAGILMGDYITKINSVSYNADTLESAIGAIKDGSEGDVITVTVERDGKISDLKVKLASIDMEYVTHRVIDGNVGYIRVQTFGNEVSSDFKEAINTLKGSAVTGIIIDLRSNPGGILDSVVEMCDLLLPEGIITTMKEKDGKVTEYKSDENEIDLPMCVLINEESASASEVMAGALHDYKKATLVGKRTFGKGVVQAIYEFGDDTALRLTVAKYYTPSGECIHGSGIAPDVEVDLPEGVVITSFDNTNPNDTQLARAVEILREKGISANAQ